MLLQEAAKHQTWSSQKGHLPSEALIKVTMWWRKPFLRADSGSHPTALNCISPAFQLTFSLGATMLTTCPKLTAHSQNKILTIHSRLLITSYEPDIMLDLSIYTVSQSLQFCKPDMIVSTFQSRTLNSVTCPASHMKEPGWDLNQVWVTSHTRLLSVLLPILQHHPQTALWWTPLFLAVSGTVFPFLWDSLSAPPCTGPL